MINLSDLTPLNISLVWISVVSIILFLYLIKDLKQAQKKVKDIKSQEENRWRDLEAKAQKDYQAIIENANKKAEEIILQATQIRQENTANLQRSVDLMLDNQKQILQTTSTDISKKYQEQIEELNKQNIEILLNIYKDIEKNARSDFEKY